MVTMFYKLDVTSIIYACLFALIYRKKYYPLRFGNEARDQKGLKEQVSKLMKA